MCDGVHEEEFQRRFSCKKKKKKKILSDFGERAEAVTREFDERIRLFL